MPEPDGETSVIIDTCPVCGSFPLLPLRRRSDDVMVIRCTSCDMGVVESRPADLSQLYSDEYYGGSDGAIGYESYEAVAEFSLGWVAELVRLLCPSGSILDVGCADGHLLRLLRPTHALHGIEVNPAYIARCRAEGIDILADDIFSPSFVHSSATFSMITAIAVLEHVSDIRGAVEILLDHLEPHGMLLFEVPLMSTTQPNDVWFSSSLEHVFYPSAPAIGHLFRLAGAEVSGSEVTIRRYGSTFVGVASRDVATVRAAGEHLAMLRTAPAGDLPKSARAFRVLLDVVYAATPSPEVIRLLPTLATQGVSPGLLDRLGMLWGWDLLALAGALEDLRSAQSSRDSDEKARKFWHEQALAYQQARDFWHERALAYEQARDFWHERALAFEQARDFWHDVAERAMLPAVVDRPREAGG